MRLDGVDISSHNAKFPKTAGLDFVICRATYGVFPDSRFSEYLKATQDAGLVAGAYHFGRHGHVDEQVQRFLEAGSGAGLLVLDLESDGGHPPMTQPEGRAFIKAVQATGRTCGLYHSLSGFPKDLGQDWNWVAAYGVSVSPSLLPEGRSFHQWQGSPLDRDYFFGTRAQLDALAGGSETPPVQPSEDVMTNLVPLTTHRVVDLPAGTVLFKTPGGQKFTTLNVPVRLGLLGGAGPDFYHVADGDAGVYVKRADATVATADMNVGA